MNNNFFYLKPHRIITFKHSKYSDFRGHAMHYNDHGTEKSPLANCVKYTISGQKMSYFKNSFFDTNSIVTDK